MPKIKTDEEMRSEFMPKYPNVSPSVTRRLPRYYRFLGELLEKGVERISSKEFSGIIGLTASQIRQDLNCFGGFGQQGYGYNVAALRNEIGHILSLDQKIPAILLGAGNLGLALVKHMGFEKRGFKLIGIFDNNPAIIGKKIRDFDIMSTHELKKFCEEHKPQTAVLCIPAESAKETVRDLVAWGVVGFWNFSHYDIARDFKDRAVVENVHLGDSLMTLCYYVNRQVETGQAEN
jgi:redox-sensing transcriptional repressor